MSWKPEFLTILICRFYLVDLGVTVKVQVLSIDERSPIAGKDMIEHGDLINKVRPLLSALLKFARIISFSSYLFFTLQLGQE